MYAQTHDGEGANLKDAQICDAGGAGKNLVGYVINDVPYGGSVYISYVLYKLSVKKRKFSPELYRKKITPHRVSVNFNRLTVFHIHFF